MNGPTLPAHLFYGDDEAPHVDSCRPHGIPIDRALCPPDNEITDRFAALAAHIAAHDLDVAPSADGDATSSRPTGETPLVGGPDRSRSMELHPSTGTWSMWTDVPL